MRPPGRTLAAVAPGSSSRRLNVAGDTQQQQTAALHGVLVDVGGELLLVLGLALMSGYSDRGGKIAAAIIVALWLVFLVDRFSSSGAGRGDWPGGGGDRGGGSW